MKIHGHNRFDAANALKPCITDKQVSRRVMCEDPVEICNVSNYIAFTNYRDAMPLEKGERRWMVIFSPVSSIEDIERVINDGRSSKDYLDELWGSVASLGDF